MRETGIHKIEVHVSGICLQTRSNGDVHVLLGKRTKNRKLYPGLWDAGGGQVYAQETLEQACLRQIKEEFGLEAEIVATVGTYAIESEEALIPGVVFLCGVQDNQSPKNDSGEFSEIGWFSLADLDSLDIISGVKRDVLSAARVYPSVVR